MPVPKRPKQQPSKILTPEEQFQQEKERELDFIKRELPFINEPTYHFQIGDKVRLGNLKDCTVDEILYDGKVYGLRCIYRSENYGNPIDTPCYRVVAWQEIRPLSYQNTNFAKNLNFLPHFNDSDIKSLIHEYYSFGIEMNPDYQRDLVWTEEDKADLLDSIFLNADIGKIVLYEPEDSLYLDKMYEILDGKQRLTTFIEFYENRFPYRGVYYNDLSPSDKNAFLSHRIQTAKLRNMDRASLLQQFILLNTTGKPMDKIHLNKVEQLLLEETEKSLTPPSFSM